MSLTTFSVFYKTLIIDATNNAIDFNEGGGELQASIDPGTYTITDILTQIKDSMDAVGGLEYIVALNRTTRKITISSTSNFDLLLSTGSRTGIGIWDDIGFSQASDLTGATTHTGGSGASSEYENQFILQDYLEPTHYVEKISPSVNESANGVIETVSFGERSFIEMSFMFITDRAMDGKVIKNNSSGVSDFLSFMNNIIQKGPLEFMPDIGSRGVFHKILLESTSVSRDGVGFRLKEMTSKNLPGFYEVKNLKFRVIS